MTTTKAIISAITLTSLVLAASKQVSADTCTTQYGTSTYGSTNCVPADLTVNKKVRMPLPPFSFVENLGENDLKFSPENEIIFSLAITNSGSENFEEVRVVDTLPNYVVSASVVDQSQVKDVKSNDDTIEFILKDLKAGETKTIEVKAKVDRLSAFGTDKSLFCEINKVDVYSEDRHADDTARFCIQTNVLGTTTLPEAGLEDYAPLMPFTIMAVIGAALMLNKKRVA